jgi:PAS domain S-box-containing protein
MSFDLDAFAREFVQHAPDAIVYADAAGIIQFWNQGAERIFGFAAAEALGQSLDIIIPERLRARHWEGYHEVMRTGRSRYGAGDLLSVPSMSKAGQRLSIEFTVLPLHDAAGRLAGIAAIMRDATARFEEMKRLRQAAAGAGDAAGRRGG